MENSRAHNYRKCQREEARRYYIYLYLFTLYPLSFPSLYLPLLPFSCGQRLSSFRLLPPLGRRAGGTLVLLLPFSSPLSESYVQRKSRGEVRSFRWKLAVATAIPRFRVDVRRARARAYGKSSQLALITLEWSTINSHNLPLDLGHGYRVLRNGSAYSALTDDDPAKKAP